VRDFVAFEEHVEGVVASVGAGGGVAPEWYQAPTFYFTNPYALIGAFDDVPVPDGSRRLDFELEVAAVIGRNGASVPVERADEHIFGYTILNDWSARDLQAREMKVMLGPAKGKDFAATLGPWLVTADELEQYRDSDGFLALELAVAVNGVEIGRDLLSDMGLCQAERMLANSDPNRIPTYQRVLRRARPRSRSGSPSASPGAPATTGARSSAADSSARASARSRTTGSTCSGSGARATCRSSSRSPTPSTWTAWSSRSTSRS